MMTSKVKTMTAAGMTAFFAIVLLATVGVYFETNDDRIFVEFLSGSLTGSSDAHAIYLNYLLSWPLMMLYRVLPGVPWYGLFLIVVHCMALFLISRNILAALKTKEGSGGGVLLCAGLLLADIYLFSRIQFTSTAALLAIAGYSCVLSGRSRNGLKRVLLFFTMEFLALLLRRDSMLMLQPLGAMALLGDFVSSGAYRNKRELKKLGVCAGAVAAALLLGQVGNTIGYSSEEWAEYQRLNDAAVVLFDYYGFPEYEEVRDILEQYGVTETEYAAYRSYVNLEYDLSEECVEALAEYVQISRPVNSVNACALLKEAWAVIFSTNRLTINNLAGILWIGAIFTCAMVRKRKVVVPFLYLATARTIVWSYLIYKGRMPDRVTRPLLFGEAVFLLLLLLRIWEQEALKRKVRALAGSISICFILWVCVGAQRQLQYVQEMNAVQEVMIESFREVREYCDNHPENQYILDCNSFSDCIGPALGSAVSGETNYIYSGGWYSNSPNVLQWIQEYLGDIEDIDSSVYLIIYDWSGEADADDCGVTVQYLQEKTAKQPVMVETLMLANGGTYLVIKF